MAALLPLSTKARTLAGALELAVRRVNADSSLLPGLTLKYEYTDSGCRDSMALTALGRQLYRTSRFRQFAAVIGPFCSIGCEQTGLMTSGRNLGQISYGKQLPQFPSSQMLQHILNANYFSSRKIPHWASSLHK